MLVVEALSAVFFALRCFLVCFFAGAFVEASGVEPDFGVDEAPAWAPKDRAAARAVPNTKLVIRFMCLISPCGAVQRPSIRKTKLEINQQ